MTSINNRWTIDRWLNLAGLILIPMMIGILALVVEIKASVEVLKSQVMEIKDIRSDIQCLRNEMQTTRDRVIQLETLRDLEAMRKKYETPNIRK